MEVSGKEDEKADIKQSNISSDILRWRLWSVSSISW